MHDRQGPLAGVRILEVGHMLAGPYCGMLLADLGADVIKIEAPSTGDIGRTVGPHVVGPHNTYFASLNRSKRSVTLDLATTGGREAFEGLVASSHGLVTNLRPSAIKKLRLTYGDLASVNPSIACLALTGYGLDGPYADRPAYDYVIQALTGLMELTGDPGGPPVKAGYSVVDNSAGTMGALALSAMIREGRGGQVDLSMHDTMLSQLNYLGSAYLNADEIPSRQLSGAHPYFVPAQIFRTADSHLALFISHDSFWRIFATEMGRPDWLEDTRFSTARQRFENRDLVVSEVGKCFATATTRTWVDRLAPLGIVIAEISTLNRALDSDLARARGMVAAIPLEAGRTLRLIGSPIRISGRSQDYAPPPLLGEHNAELLPAPPREPEPASGVDRRRFSRALSRIANATVAEALACFDAIAASKAWRIGFTGPPGAGKSSIIPRIVPRRLASSEASGRTEQLAVIAIDPSSPRSGGAILGDRIRMDAIADDERVFIRSLAGKGSGHGLTHNIVDVLELADLHGFREVIVETVGVGQSEHGIRDLVDTLVLVLHPNSGDSIQAMKAGMMELADIYVVNKSDIPEAKVTASELRSILKASPGGAGASWAPPVIEISRDSEAGLDQLAAAIDAHKAHLQRTRAQASVDTARRRFHVRSLIERRVDEALETGAVDMLSSAQQRFFEIVRGIATAPAAPR